VAIYTLPHLAPGAPIVHVNSGETLVMTKAGLVSLLYGGDAEFHVYGMWAWVEYDENEGCCYVSVAPLVEPDAVEFDD